LRGEVEAEEVQLQATKLIRFDAIVFIHDSCRLPSHLRSASSLLGNGRDVFEAWRSCHTINIKCWQTGRVFVRGNLVCLYGEFSSFLSWRAPSFAQIKAHPSKNGANCRGIGMYHAFASNNKSPSPPFCYSSSFRSFLAFTKLTSPKIIPLWVRKSSSLYWQLCRSQLLTPCKHPNIRKFSYAK